MIWRYKSRVGVFWIEPREDGWFTLGVDDDALGSYHSAEAAADDVAMRSTGHFAWDSASGTYPRDLTEWILART